MKKVIILFAMVAAFTACTSTETPTSTESVSTDTTVTTVTDTASVPQGEVIDSTDVVGC